MPWFTWLKPALWGDVLRFAEVVEVALTASGTCFWFPLLM